MIGQVVIDRLIVVVENEGTATHNDALRWRSHGKSVDLTKAAVKSLGRGVRAHVPDSNHATDVTADHGMGALDPLYTNKTVVMAFHQKDAKFDLRVPQIDIVI